MIVASTVHEYVDTFVHQAKQLIVLRPEQSRKHKYLIPTTMVSIANLECEMLCGVRVLTDATGSRARAVHVMCGIRVQCVRASDT